MEYWNKGDIFSCIKPHSKVVDDFTVNCIAIRIKSDLHFKNIHTITTFLSYATLQTIQAAFPLAKASSHITALPLFKNLPCVSFLVSIPQAVRPTVFRQMGSLTCAQMWVRSVHTKGVQVQTSLHKSWLGGTEQLSLTLPRQGIEPRVFGLKLRRSNHWPMSSV